MTNPAKPPTQWVPVNPLGVPYNLGNVFLVDNSGNFLVDNSGNFFVTTPAVLVQTPPVTWGTGSVGTDIVEDEAAGDVLDEMGNDIYSEDSNEIVNATQWLPPHHNGTIVNIGNAFIFDNSGNFLVDNSHNFLVTTPLVDETKPATSWSPTPHS